MVSQVILWVHVIIDVTAASLLFVVEVIEGVDSRSCVEG